MKQRFLYSLLSLLAAIMVTGGVAYGQQPEVRGTLSPESIEVGAGSGKELDVYLHGV